MELVEICRRAKEVSRQIGNLGTQTKNEALLAVAEALLSHAGEIISANEKDLANGRERRMPEGLLDRLMLNEERIAQMAEGLRQVTALDDPIGEVISMKKRPNGLRIGQKRVPLGVVGMIYEARPNVTVDAFGLCFKTGNAVILKGGSDAIHSNIAIVSVIREALLQKGLPGESVSLIEDTSRETAAAFMKMNGYVDVLIPRGGAGLIRAVVEQATVPVIETGTGNCHIFVDESADLDMAVRIIMNAKTQRIGVCNACESLLVHEKITDALMPRLVKELQTKNVEIHGDERSLKAAMSPDIKRELLKPATEEDWGTEYLDYVISAKTVSSLDEAINHINRYNTGHSEAIITNDYSHAERFLDEVDAACVYVNASTRFSDGFEFGFGAEIGISTQKLHARGPMGLLALTSTKYVIYGNGQVRQ
ncbi:MAG: glutamate-5-semialdehyde dehydrogenase [Roseburia sp.]